MADKAIRPLCNALKRSGDRCRQYAGLGTDHVGVGPCKVHGGNTKAHKVHGARILADMKLRRELAKMAVPLDGPIDPQRMLLAMVAEAAGNVAYLGARVAELAEIDSGPTLGEQEVSEEDQEIIDQVLPSNRTQWARMTGYAKGSHLFGPKIDVDKEGDEHIVGEMERGMVKLYGEWVDRLAKFSKMALDAGIAKQQVELAQSQGQTLVVIINRVLLRVGMTEEQALAARSLIAEEFRLEGQKVVSG